MLYYVKQLMKTENIKDFIVFEKQYKTFFYYAEKCCAPQKKVCTFRASILKPREREELMLSLKSM